MAFHFQRSYVIGVDFGWIQLIHVFWLLVLKQTKASAYLNSTFLWLLFKSYFFFECFFKFIFVVFVEATEYKWCADTGRPQEYLHLKWEHHTEVVESLPWKTTSRNLQVMSSFHKNLRWPCDCCYSHLLLHCRRMISLYSEICF